MALVNLQDIGLSFGGPLLFDRINLSIEPGERLALLGRNGSGKTTLLKLINGDLDPEEGAVIRQQGISTALLDQEVPGGLQGKVLALVTEGLGEKGRLLAEYYQVSSQLTAGEEQSLLARLDRIQQVLEAGGGWQVHTRVERMISRLELDPHLEFASLSAGLKRRVLLARALICEPDILLLDEPTNHMDIDTITWLEEFLSEYTGTLLFVSHDRMLVQKLATRIIEIDRGRLSSWACDYNTFLERRAAQLEAEADQWAKFDKKLAKEEIWIRQGIKARRTRNEGRVKKLAEMREQRRQQRGPAGLVRLQAQEARRSGRLVIEAENVSFSYGEQVIVRGFSTTVMRGDRLGVIGPNGSGKTTLLRLLLGDLQPQQGQVRRGTNLDVVYFDQLREQLDEEKTVLENAGGGNDFVFIHGKQRHIIGYLQDFLFTPARARSQVKVLSGGERSRLLLARLFTKPFNLLVMDEPTNDLDVETLELLEDLLLDYSGTLLLVSHDRAFLNNVVTGTLVLEGQGQVNEYVGGYDDWLRQRKPDTPPGKGKGAARVKKQPGQGQRLRKLSYKEERELESLPQRIEDLEREQQQLYQLMADADFYRQPGSEIAGARARLQALHLELHQAYQRWETLDEIKRTRDNEK